jgi:hypothetical protein
MLGLRARGVFIGTTARPSSSARGPRTDEDALPAPRRGDRDLDRRGGTMTTIKTSGMAPAHSTELPASIVKGSHCSGHQA